MNFLYLRKEMKSQSKTPWLQKKLWPSIKKGYAQKDVKSKWAAKAIGVLLLK